MIDEWDRRFLALAQQVSSWSKDPSTKCGAVIVDASRRIVSTGYNGFPRGVEDNVERYLDRETKYAMIVHADANAILFAKRDLLGCTMYVHPFLTCSRCAGLVIQSGIKRVVAPKTYNLRWDASFTLAKMMYEEAGVEVCLAD